jgi:hypothetical protein
VVHARRIYIATPDEARAASIGFLCVGEQLVEGWQWYETPGALAVAVIDGARPVASVIDHLRRTETIEACAAIRAVDRRACIIAAYNGDLDQGTRIPFEYVASAWIPRATLLRDLVWVLGLYGVTRRR